MAVRLSDGFYPIGIKEYGGVLYIVSAKQPDIVPVEFNDATTYAKGVVVYDIVFNDGIKYYYESLKDANGDTLPAQSNESWLYIGLETDFINKYGFIEFGSYPSPEVVGADRLDTSLPYEVINDSATVPSDFKAALYSPLIINDSPFRAGVYVQFTPVGAQVLSATTYRAYTYDEATEILEQQSITKSIYKVRLLHQLTNGYVDLTDDVWEKYAIFYKTTTGFDLNVDTGAHGTHYWFTDPNFKYYCPHNFKGKLALTVELEELDMFSAAPVSIEQVSTNYVITFSVSYANSAGWNIGITPKKVTLAYTTDGSEPDYITIPSTSTVLLNKNLPTFTLTLDVATYGGTLLRYKILPDFYYQMELIDRKFFPQKFLDMHTITGSKVIASQSNDIGIKLETSTNLCETGNSGYRILQRMSLVDSSGGYVDENNDPSTDKYQYLLDDPSVTIGAGEVLIAKYTPNATTGKAEVIPASYVVIPEYKDYLESLVEDVIVKVYDPTCAFITLTVNTNVDYAITPIVVSQGGNAIGGAKTGPTQYTYNIQPGVAVKVAPITSNNLFQVGLETQYNATLMDDTTISFGLPIRIYSTCETVSINQYIDKWLLNVSSIVFVNAIPPDRFTATQTNTGIYPITAVDNSAITGGAGPSPIFYYTTNNINNFSNRPTYNLTFEYTGAHTFDNLRVGGVPAGAPISIAREGTKQHIFYVVNTGISSTNFE